MSGTISGKSSGPHVGAAWPGRVEDAALLAGRGRFSDDRRSAGEAVAVFVRSPHAAARIRGIDVAAALTAPGVLAALTAADMAEGPIGNISQLRPFPGQHAASCPGEGPPGARIHADLLVLTKPGGPDDR